jgi:hypothetical protein
MPFHRNAAGETTQMLLSADQLKEFVAADTVAIRGTATLEPAGGPGQDLSAGPCAAQPCSGWREQAE